MSSLVPVQRYPKRKRAAISYQELFEESGEENDDDLAKQVNSDNDEDDWKSKKKAKNSKALGPKFRKFSKKKTRKGRFQFFPFMRLPPELRNKIYRLSLETPTGVVHLGMQAINASRTRRVLFEGDGSPWGFNAYHRSAMYKTSSRNLALLRVSKTVFGESIGYVYSQTFNFNRLPALQTFLLRMSPDTIARMTNIELTVTESEWALLPGISAQLAENSNLVKFKINNIGGHTGNFIKYLKASNRPIDTWVMNQENFDKLLGIHFARDIYASMYPFLTKTVKDKGIEKLLDILDMFEEKPQAGSGFWDLEMRFGNAIKNAPWTAARA